MFAGPTQSIWSERERDGEEMGSDMRHFISYCDERKMVVEICFGFWVFCVL